MSHINNPGQSGVTHIDNNAKSIIDCQNDSGFLSGSNLLSSSSIVDDSPPAAVRKPDDNTRTRDTSAFIDKSASYQGTDSGIDICGPLSSLDLTSADSTTLPAHSKSNLGESAPLKTTSSTTSPQEKNFGLTQLEVSFLQEVFNRDEDGDTQLHVAVMGGFVEVAWHITRILPHQAFLDLPNNNGKTALHLAVGAGDAALARHILACGGSPSVRDCRGNTPLHVACSLSNMEMVTELTRPITEHEIVFARLKYLPRHVDGLVAADLSNYDGQTCIHIAARCGNMAMLQHLYLYGADINAKDGKCGRTALHYAVESRDPNLVTFLSQTCRASLFSETYAGLTPYQLALANDAPAIATLLVELGAQGDPLPSRFAEDDHDNDDLVSYSYAATEADWDKGIDDLRLGGISVPRGTSIPVTSAGPLNCDLYL